MTRNQRPPMQYRFYLGILLLLLSYQSVVASCPVPASQPWYMHQPDCSMYKNGIEEDQSARDQAVIANERRRAAARAAVLADAQQQALAVQASRDQAAEAKRRPSIDGQKLLRKAKTIGGVYDNDPNLKVSEGKEGRFNCTTYAETALRSDGFEITPAISKQINIVLPEGSNLPDLLAKSDPRMTGVVGALVDSGQGTLVRDSKDCAQGDALQMWKVRSVKNKDTGAIEKKAFGHTGIVDQSNGRDVVLWGAHDSLGKVGSNPYRLGEWDHVWCVRPKKP